MLLPLIELFQWLGYWCRPTLGATPAQRRTAERESGRAAAARIQQHDPSEATVFLTIIVALQSPL